jgi:hypothetical protein
LTLTDNSFGHSPRPTLSEIQKSLDFIGLDPIGGAEEIEPSIS